MSELHAISPRLLVFFPFETVLSGFKGARPYEQLFVPRSASETQ